jgi:hypothetical protein
MIPVDVIGLILKGAGVPVEIISLIDSETKVIKYKN